MHASLLATTISSENTLTTFLCHAVAANRAEQKTLALVVPEFVALQPAFFCDLAESWRLLREKLGLGTTIMLRVDYCSSESKWGWFREIQQRIDLLRSQRAIERRNLSDVISLTRCLVVGRPGQDASSIVLAISTPQVVLPEWVKPAEMSLPGL